MADVRRSQRTGEEVVYALPAFQVWEGGERGVGPQGAWRGTVVTHRTSRHCLALRRIIDSCECCDGPSTHFVTLALSPRQSLPPTHCSSPRAGALGLRGSMAPRSCPQEGPCLRRAYRACCLEAQGLAIALGLRQRSCKLSGLFNFRTTIMQGRFALVLAQS